MTHIGIICPSETGHLTPMLALGHELQRRGYSVTVFQLPDTQQKVLSAGLNCQLIGQSEFPLGSMPQRSADLGKLSGVAGVRYTIQFGKRVTATTLRELPDAIKAVDVDALLVDQGSREAGTVAEFLGIPFITVCNALLFNSEASIPPGFTHWSYNLSWWALLRNRMGYSLIKSLAKPVLDIANEYRQQWKLPPHSHPNALLSLSPERNLKALYRRAFTIGA